MFERRLYYHIDWALLLAVFALCGLGVVMIYSTTSDPTRGVSHMYVTQMYAIAIGLGPLVRTNFIAVCILAVVLALLLPATRQVILPTGFVDNKVCAVTEVWSGLRFVLRRELR